MSIPDLPPDLAKRLEGLRKQGGRGIDPEAIAKVVERIMASMEGDLSAVNLKLYAELEALARYIAEAKAEITALRPDEIRDQHLPTAADELGAIVGATEQATNTILEAAEAIETASATMPPETASAVTEAVTRVYEACNFQDITGQRITKVIKTLQHIETKVDALLSAFGDEIDEYRRANPAAPAEAAGDDLLNGPQLPDEAAKQAEIDALLASLE